ncbi:MAG: VOC family protein [Stappiaceae bacterium]
MKFRYTILYVDDVARTLSFFTEAFGFEKRFVHESGDYGELDTGETRLAFSSRKLMTSLGKTPGDARPEKPVFEIAFETADVETAMENALKAGAVSIQDPREEAWGQKTAYVSEENGFLIEICTPVAPQP